MSEADEAVLVARALADVGAMSDRDYDVVANLLEATAIGTTWHVRDGLDLLARMVREAHYYTRHQP
jgi:hypothetical protein